MKQQSNTSFPLAARHVYLVGIKGVAMAALAECLIDAGLTVSGADVAEDFVTQPTLDRLSVTIDVGFDHTLPLDVDLVIYTSAHGASANPLVKQAEAAGITTLSHAQALGKVSSVKQTVAVCGVGGKSTVSAMITWVLEKTGRNPSFAVGVGSIVGLDRVGAWRSSSDFFVAEADDYADNPATARAGQLTARFSYLKPTYVVVSKIQFDHPDVYRNLEHTQEVFLDFLSKVPADGVIVSDVYNKPLLDTAVAAQKISAPVHYYGQDEQITAQLESWEMQSGKSVSSLEINREAYMLTLQVPGEYNAENALAAITILQQMGVPIADSIEALATFASTKRRFELVPTKLDVTTYDDYAHHPHEVRASIQALQQLHPDRRTIVAFQPHTYSRTKELFDDFVSSFVDAPEIVVLDIFASAREHFDPEVSSQGLVAALKQTYPDKLVSFIPTVGELAGFIAELPEGAVILTLGAGDIYQVYNELHE